MNLIYYIAFLLIWIILWGIIIYLWAHFRYDNKEEVDKYFEERKEFQEKSIIFENKSKEYEENIEILEKELEHAKREIAEKNRYLSEDKVIIERLGQIKELSDNISNILLDYDKETIHDLLIEYKKQENDKENEISYDNKKIWW